MNQLTDDHDILTVRTRGMDVDSVSLRSGWKRHYDAESLSLAITDLLKQAMPEPLEAPFRVPERPILKPGPADPVAMRAFWSALVEYRAALASLRERSLLGETLAASPTEATDDRRRVGVSYTSGRFEAIGLEPTWLKNAPIQEISDVITTVLQKNPLVQDTTLADQLTRVAALRREVAIYRDQL